MPGGFPAWYSQCYRRSPRTTGRCGALEAQNFGVDHRGFAREERGRVAADRAMSQCVPTPPFVLVAPDDRLARRRRGGVIGRSVDANELAGPPAIMQQGTLRGTEGRQWRGTERHRDPDRDEPDGRKATTAVTRYDVLADHERPERRAHPLLRR